MARSGPLFKYSAAARKYAYIDARNKGYSHHDTLHNPDCIEFMILRASQYAELRQDDPRPGRATKAPNVPAPVPVRLKPIEASTTGFEALATLGFIRGLYVVADGSRGYKITLKLDHHEYGHVYRYGIVRNISEVESVLFRWYRDPYWTPDKL